MSEKLLKSLPLLKECVEALGIDLLPRVESNSISDLFDLMVPLTDWGKVDWIRIDRKVDVGKRPEDIIPVLTGLLGGSFDTSVYIVWSSMFIPIIKTDIESIVKNYIDVICVSFEKFIFNPDVGYVIEILPSRQITAGLIPNYEEVFLKKK